MLRKGESGSRDDVAATDWNGAEASGVGAGVRGTGTGAYGSGKP